MAKSLFNAAQYEITQPVLRPGNYLAKIVRIEDEEKGQGNQFVCEFSAPEGKITQGFWYDHPTEAAERIGKNDLKRICIYTGNRDIDLQEDPRSWEPLKDKPIGIAVRRQKNKDGSFATYQKNGKTFDRFEIRFFGATKEELPAFDDEFNEDEEPAEENPRPVYSAEKNVIVGSKGGLHSAAQQEGDDVPF